MSRSQELRTVVGGVLATAGLILACLATIQGPALAGMRWDASAHRPAAIEGGQRLVAAAPVVSELTRWAR